MFLNSKIFNILNIEKKEKRKNLKKKLYQNSNVYKD